MPTTAVGLFENPGLVDEVVREIGRMVFLGAFLGLSSR